MLSKGRKILPLFDRLLIQRCKPQERTSTGIFIPEKAQESLNEGVVVAAGPGALDKSGKHIPVSLSVGDRVLLPAFGGSNVKVDGEDYLIYRDNEILAKLD